MKSGKSQRWAIFTLAAVNVLFTATLLLHYTGEARARIQMESQAAATMAHVQSCVRSLDLTEAETVWNRPAWMYSYSEALAKARRTNRPIFLFTMKGTLGSRC